MIDQMWVNMGDTGELSYSDSDGLGYRDRGRNWEYSDEYDEEGNNCGPEDDY